MKYWFLLLFLLSCNSVDPIDVDCEIAKQPDLACIEVVDLVCGCNGTTYMNSCYALKDGIIKTRPQAIDNPNDKCNPW